MSKTPTTRQQSTNPDPNMAELLRTATYFSLFVMIILMPLWFAFGRALFEVGGWGIFMTLPLAVILVFPYHILIAILAFLGKKRNLSGRSLTLILSYYLFAAMAQLSFVDGGDTTESVGSVFTFSGMPEVLNTFIFIVSLFGGIAAMIGIIVSLSKDIARRKHR
ncbi:MAG TPA: hypothetical protein VGE13_03835 [Candidatus Saccharimonadales bacterium]